MIGILIPNNLWFCPYVGIYTNILNKNGVPYEIVTWCRDGKDEQGCIQCKDLNNYSNNISRLLSYYLYSCFVKRVVKRKKYEKLIVFTPQLAIFIAGFLKRHYRGKYIFDYRDLSIEQRGIFKKPFVTVLNNSMANVISSPGFKTYLPEGFNYVLSHNFNIGKVRQVLNNDTILQPSLSFESIEVLTIGGIRDYDSNVQVIDALSNKQGFTVRFVGQGPSAETLKQHAKRIGANNVHFEGYYSKEKEAGFIEDCTFMNIFYPRLHSHDTALSNRFYNSLIYKKPMITTADTTQGNYARDYSIGVAIENCDGLDHVLKDFLNGIDIQHYSQQCNDLLASFVLDYEKFEGVVKQFVS